MTPEEIAALPEGTCYATADDEGWRVMLRGWKDRWVADTGTGGVAEAGARRIAACLNACANVPDEALTPGSVRQLCADALAAIDEGLEDYELGQRLRAVLRGERREEGENDC
jgi:hypothetical protein